MHPAKILNLNRNEVGFALTPLGETLRRNVPESMRKHARLVSHHTQYPRNRGLWLQV